MSTRSDRGAALQAEAQALIDASDLTAKTDILVTCDARDVDKHSTASAGIIVIQPLPGLSWPASGVTRATWQIAVLVGLGDGDPLVTWDRIDDLVEVLRPILPRPTATASPTEFPRDGGVVLPGYLLQFPEDTKG